MPRALLNFQHYGDAWTIHFVQDDCRTRIGSRTRYFQCSTQHDSRRFVRQRVPVFVRRRTAPRESPEFSA
jgi:hypothetical protein